VRHREPTGELQLFLRRASSLGALRRFSSLALMTVVSLLGLVAVARLAHAVKAEGAIQE
jgi:hypothetical protein